MSRINRWIVRVFEKEQAKPPKRPLEIAGSAWYGPAYQERICTNCNAVMVPGTGRLKLGQFCGKCWLLLDPEAA